MLIKNYLMCVTSGKSHKKLQELSSNPAIPPVSLTKVRVDSTISDVFFKSPSVGPHIYKQAQKLLETLTDINVFSLNPTQQHIFFYFYLFIFPAGGSLEKQNLFTLNMWYYLFSYKGWRYFFDLPVNGQRTWSNNKTKYRLKNKLYDFQIKCFKKKYGIHTKTNLKMSFMSEHINLMWKSEWLDEWLSAYNIFTSTKQKTKFFRLKINYRHLLNLQITTPKSIEHKKKKKNRKKIKSEFTVGFDTLYVVSLFSKKKYLFKHL